MKTPRALKEDWVLGVWVSGLGLKLVFRKVCKTMFSSLLHIVLKNTRGQARFPKLVQNAKVPTDILRTARTLFSGSMSPLEWVDHQGSQLSPRAKRSVDASSSTAQGSLGGSCHMLSAAALLVMLGGRQNCQFQGTGVSRSSVAKHRHAE